MNKLNKIIWIINAILVVFCVYNLTNCNTKKQETTVVCQKDSCVVDSLIKDSID